MKSDLVSIIVPVYNCEQYIDRCLNSIINQTYRNIEVLVVDDGSTDQSGDIIDCWGGKDSRIRIFHKENGGVSSSRNLGLDHAKGEYVCFADADDWVEEDWIEYLYKLIKESEGIQISVCGFETNSDFQIHKDIGRSIVLIEDEDAFLYMWNIPFTFTKMFHRQLFEKNRIRFNEAIAYSEDSLFCFQTVEKCRRIILGDAIKYHYFQGNLSSATNKKWSLKRVDSLIGYKYMANAAHEINLRNQKIFQSGYVSQCIRALLHKCVSENKELYFNICKSIRKYLIQYIFTNSSRLKGKILIAFKILALMYSVLPYSIGKKIARYE